MVRQCWEGLRAGKLGALSTFMCAAVIVGGAFTLIALLWVWLNPALVEAFVAPRLGLARVPVATDLTTRLVGLAIGMVPMCLLFYILYQAFRLFDAYRRGDVFTANAPIQLRRIGIALITLGFLRPMTRTLHAILLTASNVPGQRIVPISISVDDYIIAALGGLLLAIGHVMLEAKRLADDSREIV